MTSDIETAQAAMLDKFEFQALAREKMRAAIRLTFATLLEDEVSAFIGAQRYERTDTRRDQRNGSYPRDLGTSAGPIRALPVPRTRQGFQTQLFERYHRRQAELDTAIGEHVRVWDEHDPRGRSGGNSDGSETQSVHRVAGLSLAGRRIRDLEETPPGGAVSLHLSGWHLLHGHLRPGRPENAHCRGRRHPVDWRARGLGLSRGRTRKPDRLGRPVAGPARPRRAARRVVDHRWRPGHAQCPGRQVLDHPAPTLCPAQDGQRAELCARRATRDKSRPN